MGDLRGKLGRFAKPQKQRLAFLWENRSMVDLNTLISPNSSFYLYWAPFIDDRGEIGGYGSLANGDTHAVLLIPCDENHPRVLGCDYSLVDAAAASRKSLVPAVQQPADNPQPQNIWRMHGRRVGPRPYFSLPIAGSAVSSK